MNIIVYCGASKGNSPIFETEAKVLGKWISDNDHTLVYGGGHIGLMGAVADTVLENGGKVTGVMPKFLADREISHPNLTELLIVDDMPIRKKKMLDIGDVCIALPGGPGTLEEITEVVSWSRIGQNDRPCIFFNQSGYYDLIEQFYDSMVQNGFLTQSDRKNIYFCKTIESLESVIENFEKPEFTLYQK
ncbi:TIGR00730 family Rossman fold protein [Macrococcus sp. DPC7161]|uniref:LOG family protein n=1 Tax=Macrococcus sp. DPC7161 TaxID=2507060 RepID=UPI00100BD8CE|nr:TIGR00730 family Rossman fold protein [Macrococcus sp. DPC7161]RXK17456.1 TIGR00730 family Rossman fold protein [Macrococcus sp. DPC7161]